MPVVTCYPADFNLPPGTDYGPLILRQHAVGDHFARASGPANIQLAMDWSRRNWLPHTNNPAGLYDQDLMHGLSLLLAPNAGAPQNIGLLVGNAYLNGQGQAQPQYGVMFDLDGQAHGPFGPRQGCAIFLGPIMLAAQAAGLGPADFQEFVAFMVIHELGHAFNLWHAPQSGSFMETYPDAGNLGNCTFVPLEANYLASASDPRNAPYVLPGLSPYNVRPTGWPRDNDQPFATPPAGAARPVLKISLSHQSFWSFEPVELDVELRAPPGSKEAFIVADEIDLGYDGFQVWITDPTGQRMRVKPGLRYCGDGGRRELHAGRPFRRDISLFRQPGEAVFMVPGIHRVQAAFRLPSGAFVLSNSVSCEVRPADPASPEWMAASQCLGAESVIRLLRFKRSSPNGTDYHRLVAFAATQASAQTNAAIRFSLGQAVLRSGALKAQNSHAQDLRRTVREGLEAAVQGGGLGKYRAKKAMRMLREMA